MIVETLGTLGDSGCLASSLFVIGENLSGGFNYQRDIVFSVRSVGIVNVFITH